MPDFSNFRFWFNVATVPIIFIAVLIPLTGLYILNQNRRSPVNRSFFMICIAILLWMTGQVATLSSVQPQQALWIYRGVVFLGVSSIAPLIYHFTVIWLGIVEKSKKLLCMGYGGFLFFYIAGLFSPLSFPGVRLYEWGFYPIYGPLNYFFLFFFFFYFFISFYNFAQALKIEKNRQRLAQIQLITVAFFISMLGSSDYIPKLINFGLYPQGFLCVFVWIMVVAYTIIRYKAMDIETVIHKTLMWLVTVVVAVLPYVVFIFVSYDTMRKLSPAVTSVLFSCLMILFYFYFQALKPHLDQLFQRRRSDLRNELEKFSKELVYLTDLRSLLQRFARLLRRSLYVKELVIYLFDEEHAQYVPVISKRIRGFKPISKDQVFLLWLSKEARVSGLEKLRQNPENETMLNEINLFFAQLHASVLMPLIVGDKLIGFVALGKRMNLQGYKHDEINFLTQVAVPVSIAISNSMQFEKVQLMSDELLKWNEELENRVDVRTRELKETQEQLIQAEKMATLGILAGGVAHEINNPLTAVLTNAQILKMTANADDAESLGMIEEGAKRCQIIVQKLLNYSRTAVGIGPSQKTDLNRAIKNTIAMLSYQIKQENIDIEFHSEDIPQVPAIQNEIEQVFTNLIVNARDAIMQQGPSQGKIQIRTYTKNKKICAEVRDNGCGIPKNIIGKIFDPFFTTKDVGEGTGLGLSVTHGIVTRFNGQIDVTSEVGQGTTFTISFPAL